MAIRVVQQLSEFHGHGYARALTKLPRDRTPRGDYNLTDSDSCTFTSNLVITMTRDQAQFTVRGVMAAMVTSLKTLGDAFEIFPTEIII